MLVIILKDKSRKDLSRHFTKEEDQIANKKWKDVLFISSQHNAN